MLAEPDFVPANLVNQSIMTFHARNDSVASVQTTRGVFNRILQAAGRPLPTYPPAGAPDFAYSSAGLDLHYIEPATGDHSVWSSVYNRPELYEWMFAHTLAVPEPGTLAGLLIGSVSVILARIRR